MKPKPMYKEYKFRCQWRSTALTIKVPGKNYADALKRAESMIRKMEGGESCVKIEFWSGGI